jgi:UDP-2,4-diacetamido-2,4,6-trideoxy-beta-L-altropyranose hydrolase
MASALRAALRADASAELGTGHLRRCLSLAQALADTGFDVEVLGSGDRDVFMSTAQAYPFEVRWLGVSPTIGDADRSLQVLQSFAPDWVVVDHYLLDANWHRALKTGTGACVLAIDDLADRLLAPDLLLDHNPHPDPRQKYAGRIDPRTPALMGPRFALLHPAYATAPRHVPAETVRSIGIFMGGTDPRNACAAALLACRERAGFDGPVEIVSSRSSPHLAHLARLCGQWPDTTLTLDLPDLREFFARHDLQLGSGGGAALERCCIGAPTLAIAVADNQLVALPHLSAQGVLQWVGRGLPIANDASTDGLLKAALGDAIRALLDAPVQRRQALSAQAMRLVDGLGSRRVAAVMQVAAGGSLVVRHADAGDEQLILDWANETSARANAFNPRPIDPDAHRHWFAARLADASACCLLLLESANAVPVAQVRFDRMASGWEISYSVDAAFRGWGVGRRALSLAFDELARRHGPSPLTARVMLHNPASVAVFDQLDFARERVHDHRGEHWLFSRQPTTS